MWFILNESLVDFVYFCFPLRVASVLLSSIEDSASCIKSNWSDFSEAWYSTFMSIANVHVQADLLLIDNGFGITIPMLFVVLFIAIESNQIKSMKWIAQKSIEMEAKWWMLYVMNIRTSTVLIFNQCIVISMSSVAKKFFIILLCSE